MIAFHEPSNPASFEVKILRSVFIADVSLCRNEADAKLSLSSAMALHKNASHYCRAFKLYNGSEYSSDDGEPSGSAGKPILNAIKHSELVNVLVIVTRYFGGVKLGVRGLIDAYGQSASQALALAGKVLRIPSKTIHINLPYNSVSIISRILNNVNASDLAWQYSQDVSVNANIPLSSCESLAQQLNELHARNIINNWESES